jgi:hypothetical protein
MDDGYWTPWHLASAENKRLQARVAELYDLIKYAQVESGVCMCGDDIKDHNQASGHSPVDVWDHAVEQINKEGSSEAFILRKQAEAVQASSRALSSCSEIPNSSGHASRQDFEGEPVAYQYWWPESPRQVTVCKAKDLPSGGPDLIVQPLYTHQGR